MKKLFVLTHPKIKYPRLVEAARHDIKKYIKRERRKELTKGVDFWDFDCKFGHTKEEAKPVLLSEIGKKIDEVEDLKLESFYIEVLAKPGHRVKKERPVRETEE